ncbi:MAG: amino acid aminotransferase [Vicinamibacterales bacterium]
MFDRIEKAPPDPILGLEEAFKSDPNPAKINLGVGVYKDERGITPVFRAVKRAEASILESEFTKTYLGIAGAPEYGAAVQALLLGPDHPVVAARRAVTAHCPGGTGSLRVAADFIKKANPAARVWISQPTWPNHRGVMTAAGLPVEAYPYFDPASNGVAFADMVNALSKAAAGDVVVLHGSCHNPTGADPSPEQWLRLADMMAERGLLPLVDFAYQGFGAGLDEDALGLRTICSRVSEVVIASSYSKNFGLYNERVGALTLIAGTEAAADAVLSQVKTVIRVIYSNPPAHGAKIVTTILGSAELRADWEAELAATRCRIRDMRRRFVAELAACGASRDFSFIERQNGMFSFTGLTKEQVRILRERHSIYMVDSGRINVAGLTPGNVKAVCGAIAEVIG